MILLLTGMLISACDLAPQYKRPETGTAFAWPWATEDAAQTASQTHDVALEWWKNFDDPALTRMIEDGLAANADLLIAAGRVAEARGILGVNEANQYPEFGIQGGAVRTRRSAAASFGGFSANSKPFNDFAVAAVLDFEVDLWGRLRNATRAARAQLLAVQANRDAIRIAVASDIANGYFTLRAIDAQLAVAENTVKSRQESVRFQGTQFRLKAIDGLVFRQAEAELASAQAQAPLLRQQRQEQETALAVLLGRTPQEMAQADIPRGAEIDALPKPPVLAGDVPSSLLERRPDIVSAEQALRASNAQIGVIRADYFPTLSLSALLGLDSSQTGRLLRGSARNWNIGANFAGPLVDFGRVSSNVEAAYGTRDQRTAEYAQTVQRAFKEVFDAMSAGQTASERVEALGRQTDARAETLRLAELRYKAGFSNYLEVLDAQRFLFQAQLDRITAVRDRLSASVNLYKALGGGWRSPAVPVMAPPDTILSPAPAAPTPATPAPVPNPS